MFSWRHGLQSPWFASSLSPISSRRLVGVHNTDYVVDDFPDSVGFKPSSVNGVEARIVKSRRNSSLGGGELYRPEEPRSPTMISPAVSEEKNERVPRFS